VPEFSKGSSFGHDVTTEDSYRYFVTDGSLDPPIERKIELGFADMVKFLADGTIY